MTHWKQILKSAFGATDGIEGHRLLWRAHDLWQRWHIQPPDAENEHRRTLPLTDFAALARPLPYYPYFRIQENNLYGNGHSLARGIELHPADRIEHGLYFGGFVPTRNRFATNRRIISYSAYRKQAIQAVADVEVYCTGPYIAYARKLLTAAEQADLRREWGRTLLVMPSHSIDSVHAEFDLTGFSTTLAGLRREYGFDSVCVCLYWKDIERRQHLAYQAQGHRVVCAGHAYDPYFLDRLRTLIELADVTLSNNLGTHIGYCVSLDKPHWIIPTPVHYRAADARAAEELHCRNPSEQAQLADEKQYVLGLFSDFRHDISAAQTQCVRHFWGEMPATEDV